MAGAGGTFGTGQGCLLLPLCYILGSQNLTLHHFCSRARPSLWPLWGHQLSYPRVPSADNSVSVCLLNRKLCGSDIWDSLTPLSPSLPPSVHHEIFSATTTFWSIFLSLLQWPPNWSPSTTLAPLNSCSMLQPEWAFNYTAPSKASCCPVVIIVHHHRRNCTDSTFDQGP